jgi:hypothetical protein
VWTCAVHLMLDGDLDGPVNRPSGRGVRSNITLRVTPTRRSSGGFAMQYCAGNPGHLCYTVIRVHVGGWEVMRWIKRTGVALAGVTGWYELRMQQLRWSRRLPPWQTL